MQRKASQEDEKVAGGVSKTLGLEDVEEKDKLPRADLSPASLHSLLNDIDFNSIMHNCKHSIEAEPRESAASPLL